MNRSTARRTGGLLLAAGRSRRMGTAKIFLPWPTASSKQTILDSAIDGLTLLIEGGPLVVVTNHENRTAIARALHDRNVVLVEADGDQPMFNSIRTGLAAMRGRSPELDGIWLHPADHPEISAATRSALIRAIDMSPDCAVMPEHEERGGHPVWIPAAWITRLLDLNETTGGLRAVWERHPEQVRRIPVDDVTAVLDLDTPEAYREAIARRTPG